MPIFINNSLTGKKEELLPLNQGKVNIYTCGVTVYDESHIGHARSLYIFDCFKRYLKYRGFEVNFVRNITDIDDKIINRARELKIGWQDLVKKYIDSYYQDLKALGIEKADSEPRATENIAQMIKAIETLREKGYAYVTNTGVYFSVRKFKDYGKLSGQSIEQMQTGSRKEPDETKEDPLDFALWKISKPDEPYWDSPWGKGRPGWHIECSVMSAKYLKTETLDIHAGGRDLIFPHHENEIAQSEALTGNPFVKYWMHHGLLTINGHKMAKSLGNFITIKDFLAKYKDADLLKLFFLSAHYSHPIDYNEEKIEETEQAKARILFLMHKIDKKVATQKSGVTKKNFKEIEESRDKFIKAMDDDFNTPQALAAIFDLVSMTNKNIDDLNFIINAKEQLKELLNILGLSLKGGILEGVDLDAVIEMHGEMRRIKDMIDRREQLKKEKKYKEADEIRKVLEEKDVILEDNKDGTTTCRKKI